MERSPTVTNNAALTEKLGNGSEITVKTHNTGPNSGRYKRKKRAEKDPPPPKKKCKQSSLK